MKKFYMLLFSLIALTEINAQNWTVLNSGTASSLSSICFPAMDTGYIAGEAGTILKTINGGTNWIILDPGHSNWFYTIQLLNTKTGWVAGENGELLKTIDGGINWESTILNPWFYRITSIYFPTTDTGYLVAASGLSGGGAIEKSTNGNYFLPILNGTTSNWLESVYFPSVNTGYAVGESGTIIKTTDGGLNWIIQTSGTINNLYSVFFTDMNTGYAVGDSGIILKTTNGGINWVNRTSGTLNKLRSVFFADINTGYAVGNNGVILSTINGGSDWTFEFSGTVKNLHSIYFTDLITGYAVGDSGLILKTTNGGGVGISEGSSASSLMKVYPNPTHDEITIETSPITDNTYVSISNVRGIELIVQKVINNRTRIDIGNIPSGVYLIRLQNDKTVIVKKIIKE
jgi:photosystem II stability/assembly factor-like uncharacterized protein